MKKSNVIIFVLLALVSAFFLWLWFFLGLNRIDEPLDLVLSIVWWAVIVAAIAIIVKMERTRRQRVRTVYVGDRALFNSEKGFVSIENAEPMHEAIAAILKNLKYDFERADFPDKEKFEVRYFVRTKEFDAADHEDSAVDEQSQRVEEASVEQPSEQKKWKGEVFVVETKEARPFDTPEELVGILASLDRAA